MPRSSSLITPHPVDAQAVAEAAGEVWRQLAAQRADEAHAVRTPPPEEFELRQVDGGAALQVLAGAELLLTVLPPRLLPRHDEVRRLRPGLDVSALPLPSFWSEVYTPWEPSGALGVAIVQTLAARVGGVVAHDQYVGESAG